MVVEPDEDLDEEEPEDPPPPPELVAALDEMLSLAVEAPPPYYPDASDTDRLVHALMAVGPAPRAVPHPRRPPQRGAPAGRRGGAGMGRRADLEFVRRCADEFVELAARCVRFAVWLWADLRPEGEARREARRSAAGEAREEALFELGIRTQRPRTSLTADKHRVADFLRPTLAFAALQCADAAHELEDRQFPGRPAAPCWTSPRRCSATATSSPPPPATARGPCWAVAGSAQRHQTAGAQTVVS